MASVSHVKDKGSYTASQILVSHMTLITQNSSKAVMFIKVMIPVNNVFTHTRTRPTESVTLLIPVIANFSNPAKSSPTTRDAFSVMMDLHYMMATATVSRPLKLTFRTAFYTTHVDNAFTAHQGTLTIILLPKRRANPRVISVSTGESSFQMLTPIKS
jgi:hypothetical protein